MRMEPATLNAPQVNMLMVLTPVTPRNVSGDSPSDNGSAAMFVYISEAIVIPVILAVGVVTNCFSLMILPRSNIAASFKTCLVALTVSDLFAGIIGFIQMLVEVLAFNGHIEWGKWDPWAVTSFSLYYIFSCLMATSCAIVIAIVAIRHYTISKPVSAKLNITSRSAKVICICLALATFVIFSPTSLMVLWQSCHKETEVMVCVRVYEAIPNLRKIALTYLLLVTVSYGPVLVLVYICCMIGIRINLERTEKILDSLQEDNVFSNADRKSRRKTTMKITKTLLLILLLDTICCIPLVVQAFAMVIAPKTTVFSTTNNDYKVFDAIAEIFLVFRQAYNFWLYAFSHKSFRLRAKTLFFCFCVPKYRILWQSPSSLSSYRGHRERVSSATSCRLRSVDLDTEATWLRKNELRSENRSALNTLEKTGKGDSVSSKSGSQPFSEHSLLNGKGKKVIVNTTKL